MLGDDLGIVFIIQFHKKRVMINSLPLFISLAVSPAAIHKAAMALSNFTSWSVSHSTIGDRLVISLHLGLLSQVLLDKCKGVHGIPPVWFLGRSFGGLRHHLCGMMNVPFRHVLATPKGRTCVVFTTSLFIITLKNPPVKVGYWISDL